MTRIVSVTAAVAGAAWLVWRAGSTVAGADAWLAVPLLLVEVAIWARFVLHVVAAWTGPSPSPSTTPEAAPGARRLGPVDVLVLGDPDLAAVRTTLVAAGAVVGRGAVRVLDPCGAAGLPVLAERLGAEIVDPAEDPVAALRHAHPLESGLGASRSGAVLVLRAGDVPMPDVLESSAGHLADPRVAVVLPGCREVDRRRVRWSNDGRDDDSLDRVVLRRALSARGGLMWDDEPALVRRDLVLAALHGSDASTSGLAASAKLLAEGWRVVAATEPVVDVPAVDGLAANLARRQRRTSTLLTAVVTRRSPLVARGLPLAARVALLDRLAGSLGAVAVLGLACAAALSLLTGAVPIAAGWVEAALRLAPWAIGAAVARNLLTGRRWLPPSGLLRTIRLGSPDLRAWAGRIVPRWRRLEEGHHMTVAAAVLLAPAGAAIARFADGAFDLAVLPPVSRSTLVLSLATGGVLAASAAEVLGLLARHRDERAHERITTDLPATVDGHPAEVVDLSPGGAALRTSRQAQAGDGVVVRLSLPGAGGELHHVDVAAEVRYRREHDTGPVLGVSFRSGQPEATDRLIEYCTVVRPFRTRRPEPAAGTHDAAIDARDTPADRTPATMES